MGTFFNYTVLQTTHKTNISRQKYNLQAQCLYGEFEGLLYHNCNEGISSAPQLKNKQNNLTQTKQPVIAVRGLGIFPKVSSAYYSWYFFLYFGNILVLIIPTRHCKHCFFSVWQSQVIILVLITPLL